jgi:hypothetical protein
MGNMSDDERPLIGYRPLSEFLTDAGFNYSHSTAQKYGALGIGPPHEGYWSGKFPTFLPSRALAWAKQQLRAPRRPRKQSETPATA